jgi:serine/threonine-protein kinase
MPNIVNLSEQQARMIIEENGFTRGQMSHTYNGSVEPAHVILQTPSAGTMITRGTKVDTLVSSGPRSVTYVMPELSGHSLDQAVLMIENANLTVGNIRSRFDHRKIRNSVIRQDPPAGYGVNVSDPVHLVINRPSGSSNGDRLHRPLYGSFLQHRIKSGFLTKRVRVEMENPNSTTDLFDDYVKAGDEIWVLVPRDHAASVFIFEDDELVKAHLYEAW